MYSCSHALVQGAGRRRDEAGVRGYTMTSLHECHEKQEGLPAPRNLPRMLPARLLRSASRRGAQARLTLALAHLSPIPALTQIRLAPQTGPRAPAVTLVNDVHAEQAKP